MRERDAFDMSDFGAVLDIYTLSDELEKVVPQPSQDHYQYVYFVHALSTVNTSTKLFVAPNSHAVECALKNPRQLMEDVELFISKRMTALQLFGVNLSYKEYLPFLQTAGLVIYPVKNGRSWVSLVGALAIVVSLLVILFSGEYASWAVLTKWNTTSATMQIVRTQLDRELANHRRRSKDVMNDVDARLTSLQSDADGLAAGLIQLQADLADRRSVLDAMEVSTTKAIEGTMKATLNLTRNMTKHVGLVETELQKSLKALNASTMERIGAVAESALQRLDDEEARLRRDLADVWAHGFANATKLSHAHEQISTAVAKLQEEIKEQTVKCHAMIRVLNENLTQVDKAGVYLVQQTTELATKLAALKGQAETAEKQVKEVRQSVGDFSGSLGGCLFFMLVSIAVGHVLYNQLMVLLDQGYYVLVKNPNHLHFLRNDDGSLVVMQETRGDGMRKLLQICILLVVFGCVFQCYVAVKAVSDTTIHVLQNPGEAAAKGLIGTIEYGVMNVKEFVCRIVFFWKKN